MKKRLFSLFTSLIMVISLVSVLPTMSVSAKTSGDYEYEILDDGTAKIKKYNGTDEILKIPYYIEGHLVTQISGFSGCNSLKKVIIPNSVTTISNLAFACCSNLETVVIGKDVEKIYRGTFTYCDSLKEIVLSSNINYIEEKAFFFAKHNTIVYTYANSPTELCVQRDDSLEHFTLYYLPKVNTNNKSFDLHYKMSLTTIKEALLSLYTSINAVSITVTDKNNVTVNNFDNELQEDMKFKVTLSNGENIIYKVHTHSYTSKVTKPATCITEGIKTFTCSCGDSYTETIPKTAHSYKATVVAPTCTAKGHTLHTCSVCENSYKSNEKAVVAHKFSSWTTTKQATCTATGSQKRTCSVCRKTETKSIETTGHKYTTTAVKPTYDAQGYTLHKCSICGASYKDNYKAKLVLGKVSKLKAFSNKTNSVKLSWNKVSGASGYYVYQQKNGKWSKIKTTKSTSYTVPKLKSGTTYKFTVRAYKNQGGKTYLSPKYTTFTTSTTPSTVSFKLTAGSKKATVKWNKVTGATGYKVYYKTSKNGSWKCLKTTNNKTTSYTKTGLTKGKSYYFTVKAYRTVSGKTYNGSYATKSIKVK